LFCSPHPALGRAGRVGGQGEHGLGRVRVQRDLGPGVRRARRDERAGVHRPVVGQAGRRHLGHHLAPEPDPQRPSCGHLAQDAGQDPPAAADLEHVGEPRRVDQGQHALLGLRDQHLPGLHRRLAQGHGVQVDLHAHPGPGRDLGDRAADPGRAQVLEPAQQAPLDQFQARLDQQFLLERVAHLHVRALGLVAVLEAGRGEDAGPADPVPAGLGSHQHGQVARLLG
jgi:hypothetical protein